MLLNPADSVLFYSQQTREANNTVRSTISLRSNRTRLMANKTGVVSLRVQRLGSAFVLVNITACFSETLYMFIVSYPGLFCLNSFRLFVILFS